MKKTDRGITMINHTQAKAMGKLSNVLYQVGVTTIIAKFLILDIPIDRDAPIVESDDLTFNVARFDVLRMMESVSDGGMSKFVIMRNKFGVQYYGTKDWLHFHKRNHIRLLETTRRSRSSRLPNAMTHTIQHWKNYCFTVHNEYLLWEGFVNRDAKIIKFRLGRRAHSLTLLEFTRRLGLYQAVELEEDGFNVYFEGGLRNDDNFNAQDYWVLPEDVVKSLSALIYCRDLDTTTLRDLIPILMGWTYGDNVMQDAIERMEYRKSYH
ncbi:hypothetical protein Tco_0706770 [Tanacetum coccineum]|uniref:Uncharacterized protein n=1 Tax=Tanacetum coccineum TaxID=301880 RepID=A0ABQ4Y8B6_9ASTR